MRCRLALFCLLPALALPACDRADPAALVNEAEAKLNALHPASEAAGNAVDADLLSEQLAQMLSAIESVGFDEWEALGGGPIGPGHDIDVLRNGSLPRPESEPAIALVDSTVTAEWLQPLTDLRATPRLVREWTVATSAEQFDPLGGRVRAMMRLLLANSRIQHHRGDTSAAAESIEYTLTLGHALQYDPVLLNRLVGTSVQMATLAEIRLQLTEDGHDASSCTQLLAAVEALCTTPPLRPALEVEAILLPPSMAHQGYGSSDIEAAQKAMTAQMDELVALQSRPYVEQDPETGFISMLMGLDLSGKRPKRSEFIASQRRMLASIPRYEARWRNERDATVLLLHIHLFNHRHGRFPDRLEQLVPSQLAALPADSVTGAAFKYGLVDGKPFLYSIGMNGVDDDGEHHPPTLLEDPYDGLDILFTTERRPVPNLFTDEATD